MSEVQGLLGVNVPNLKMYENNTVVHNWIIQQLQSDLNTLGIGLTGGRVASTATTASTPANANATANANSTANANATSTIKPTGTHSPAQVHTATHLHKHTHTLTVFHYSCRLQYLHLLWATEAPPPFGCNHGNFAAYPLIIVLLLLSQYDIRRSPLSLLCA